MKILMILESGFPPDVRVENEMLALTEAGHEVHLACSTRKNRPLNDRWNNVVIHRKPMSTFIYKSSVGCLKFPFYFNFWRKHIFNLLKEDKFDTVHINDLPLSRIGAEVKRKYGIPLIIDLHENWPALLKEAVHTNTFMGKLLSSYSQWVKYEKKMLSQADMIITVVEEARERITALGVPQEKSCIVSNTVRTENLTIRTGSRTDSDFVLFYGGGVNRHRGLQIVLGAVKILKDRQINIKFRIVGSGSYVEVLKKQAKDLDIESHVIFSGHKPYNEMLDLLAEADAAIIPHLRTDNNDASSPNKLYQYMYLEKPVISSDCISLKRIIGETECGYTYKNDSPDSLAELLEKIIRDRNLLVKAGLNGKKAVIAKYNWSRDKERLIQAYSIIESRQNHNS